MDIKITTTKGDVKAFGPSRRNVVTFYANGIAIAYLSRYSEWFCTVKNGRPSNIRDKTKLARDIRWNREGLKELLGHNNFTIGSPIRRFSGQDNKPVDFMDDYPDTTWGYAGGTLTSKSVKEEIERCIQKYL